MPQNILKYGWLCGLLLCVSPAFAQANPDTTITAALRSLGDRAGVVFAGQVTAIRHVGGVVEVEFSVEQTVKGTTSGNTVLREWSGLWAAGQRRYWIGEHAVVFLNVTGKSGLSSSVDGMEGILPISPDATSTLSVDVQRIRTRVLRDSGAPMVESTGRMSLAQIASSVRGEPVVAPIWNPAPPPVRSLPITQQAAQTPDSTPLQLVPAHKIPTIRTQLNAIQ